MQKSQENIVSHSWMKRDRHMREGLTDRSVEPIVVSKCHTLTDKGELLAHEDIHHSAHHHRWSHPVNGAELVTHSTDVATATQVLKAQFPFNARGARVFASGRTGTVHSVLVYLDSENRACPHSGLLQRLLSTPVMHDLADKLGTFLTVEDVHEQLQEALAESTSPLGDLVSELLRVLNRKLPEKAADVLSHKTVHNRLMDLVVLGPLTPTKVEDAGDALIGSEVVQMNAECYVEPKLIVAVNVDDRKIAKDFTAAAAGSYYKTTETVNGRPLYLQHATRDKKAMWMQGEEGNGWCITSLYHKLKAVKGQMFCFSTDADAADPSEVTEWFHLGTWGLKELSVSVTAVPSEDVPLHRVAMMQETVKANQKDKIVDLELPPENFAVVVDFESKGDAHDRLTADIVTVRDLAPASRKVWCCPDPPLKATVYESGTHAVMDATSAVQQRSFVGQPSFPTWVYSGEQVCCERDTDATLVLETTFPFKVAKTAVLVDNALTTNVPSEETAFQECCVFDPMSTQQAEQQLLSIPGGEKEGTFLVCRNESDLTKHPDLPGISRTEMAQNEKEKQLEEALQEKKGQFTLSMRAVSNITAELGFVHHALRKGDTGVFQIDGKKTAAPHSKLSELVRHLIVTGEKKRVMQTRPKMAVLATSPGKIRSVHIHRDIKGRIVSQWREGALHYELMTCDSFLRVSERYASGAIDENACEQQLLALMQEESAPICGFLDKLVAKINATMRPDSANRIQSDKQKTQLLAELAGFGALRTTTVHTAADVSSSGLATVAYLKYDGYGVTTVVSGSTGPYSHVINGAFYQTTRKFVNGRPVYAKLDDPQTVMWMSNALTQNWGWCMSADQDFNKLHVNLVFICP